MGLSKEESQNIYRMEEMVAATRELVTTIEILFILSFPNF